MRRETAMLDRASFSSRTHRTDQLAQATLRATNLLAVACLFFGTGCAALVPESLEQRLGSLFLYGLIPAVAFHGGGYILSLVLGATNELCEMLAARCFRCAVHLLYLVSTWLVPLLPGASVQSLPVPTCAKVNDFTKNAFRSIHHFYWRADAATYEFACWVIRSVARFLIRIQSTWHLHRGR